MNAIVNVTQDDFEIEYKDAVTRITAMDHGLSEKSLAWVLDKEWALRAHNHPDYKMFKKTIYDWCLQIMRQEQQVTRKAVVYDVIAPVNPYYPNNTKRVGD